MLNDKYTSAEWEKLWKELETSSTPKGYHEVSDKIQPTKNMKVGDFGVGAMMIGNYADPLAGFQAEIRAGAGHIEFSPAAMGGQGGNMDFTKIGAERRQALKELAKVNKATIATHAHPGITGMSGFDERSYSFSEENRRFGMNEVRKAIEFAADVAGGGPVTFHAGEFSRPLQGQKNLKGEFEMTSDEKDQMILIAVDRKNKAAIRESRVMPNEKFVVPIFDNKAGKIRIEGTKIEIPNYMRDEKDPDQIKTKEFNNFREYAAWLAQEDDAFKNELKERRISAEIIDKKDGKKEIEDFRVLELATKRKYRDTVQSQLAERASQSISQVQRQLDELKKIDVAVDKAKNAIQDKSTDKVFIMRDLRRAGLKPLTEEQFNEITSKESIDKDDFVQVTKDGKVKSYDGKSDAIFEALYTGDVRYNELENKKSQALVLKENIKAQIEDQMDRINNVDTVSNFALDQAKQGYAQLGMEAYEMTQFKKKSDKDFKPIYLAVENLFPEKYGSQPEELISIIKSARKEMEKELIEQKKVKSPEEAKKIAEQTIKTTFDTGHLHMWRKYFRYKENETPEDRDKAFNKWALGQTQKLVDEGMIGNIHLADNFGYGDDHLAAGQGIVPLKEYIKMFDEAKGKGLITGKIAVEGGFDEHQSGVHEAWKATGAQIFRASAATNRWVNPESDSSYRSYHRMEDSYLGQASKPYFVFGKYSPDRDEWAPWSDTTLE